MDLPKRVALKDGRIATIGFLGEKDSARELQGFINALVEEGAYIVYDRKATLKEENAWKKNNISKLKRRDGYILVARVDGKLAGTTGADRERMKGRHNVSLGLAIAKPYRRIGLGEALLRANIGTARRLMKPKNIYLSVFAPNKPARILYRKLGFREFAIFPKWLLHSGKYVDHVFMLLKK
jgi:RimJ/RimL family protein N-acetyltransferase